MASTDKRLTAQELRRLGHALELIGRTLPWTATTDRISPDHPWVDVWGGDGDLLLEVGDNLAYEVYGPDLAAALIRVVSAVPMLLSEVEQLRVREK